VIDAITGVTRAETWSRGHLRLHYIISTAVCFTRTCDL